MAINYSLMTPEHIDGIYNLSRISFSVPWSKDSISKELDNNLASYVVAVDEASNEVIGFVGMWVVAGEGDITNIAVSPSYRQQGIGYSLLIKLLEICVAKNCSDLTLEVRSSNIPAQKLYEKVGFISEGLRKKYYQDNGEDAIIMWKHNIIG